VDLKKRTWPDLGGGGSSDRSDPPGYGPVHRHQNGCPVYIFSLGSWTCRAGHKPRVQTVEASTHKSTKTHAGNVFVL